MRANVEWFETWLFKQASLNRRRLKDPVLASIIVSTASQLAIVLRPHLVRVHGSSIADEGFVKRYADTIADMLFVETVP